ncbi:MAG: holo-[acyl-carrier protein] synthase [Kangiellaceae bacterium]|jgi:holo-[acyl-carrier protein] synthase
MLFGIGTDIVEIIRIQKAVSVSERFALRILTVDEMTEYSESKYPERYLAKKFAAKEALVKAMGTGIGNGYSWQMIQIEHNQLGKPFFVFNGAVKDFMSSHNISNCLLSISDEQHYATAMVVLEAG